MSHRQIIIGCVYPSPVTMTPRHFLFPGWSCGDQSHRGHLPLAAWQADAAGLLPPRQCLRSHRGPAKEVTAYVNVWLQYQSQGHGVG